MKQVLIIAFVLAFTNIHAQNNARPVVKPGVKSNTHKNAVATGSKLPKKTIAHPLKKGVSPNNIVASPAVLIEEKPLPTIGVSGQNLQKENVPNNNDKPGKSAIHSVKSLELKKSALKQAQPPQ